MLLALGICAAFVEVQTSGKGQVVDAAMTDGSALLATMIHTFLSMGVWGDRGTNMLDTGALSTMFMNVLMANTFR